MSKKPAHSSRVLRRIQVKQHKAKSRPTGGRGNVLASKLKSAFQTLLDGYYNPQSVTSFRKADNGIQMKADIAQDFHLEPDTTYSTDEIASAMTEWATRKAA